MDDILISGIFLLAIPLAMNNVNGRYTGVVGLITNLHDTMEQTYLSATKRSIFIADLVSMKRCMQLIKATQFFCVLAFVFSLLFVLTTYLSAVTINPLLFPTAIILMVVSMSASLLRYIYQQGRCVSILATSRRCGKDRYLNTTSKVQTAVSLVLAWDIVVLPFQHDIE